MSLKEARRAALMTVRTIPSGQVSRCSIAAETLIKLSAPVRALPVRQLAAGSIASAWWNTLRGSQRAFTRCRRG